MKITRSFWLGLGSGLILSALLTLVFSLQQGHAVIPEGPATGQSIVTSHADADPDPVPVPVPPLDPPIESDSAKLPSEFQGATQVDWAFVIPKGASAEGIADLLVAQDFIKDRATFLERVRQMRVERQFRAGTFNLSLGLTEGELINRLLK